MTCEVIDNPGHDKLSCWFGLSYASWVTLPRIMMEDMPDEWQGKMADLLNEYSDVFTHCPDVGTRVNCTTPGGRLTKTPPELLNYRHPDKDFLRGLKGERANEPADVIDCSAGPLM